MWGSWTEGRCRWMVKEEKEEGCEKKCNARTCRPISCHFYRRIHSFPLLEFILRPTLAIRSEKDVNHRCLGYKTPLSFARQRPRVY